MSEENKNVWINIDKSVFKEKAIEILSSKHGKYPNRTLARDTLKSLGVASSIYERN